VEYRVVRPDGSVRWVRDRGFPVRDGSGRVYRTAGIAQDITEARRADECLRASERRFRALARHAPVGIFQTDAEGNCLFVNERWCQMAGLSAEAAAGQCWVGALHPDDRDRIFREWYAAAKAGREFAGEYRFRTPQGQVTWLSGSAVALRDEAGGVSGYLGTVTDISGRKQAEQSLREADRRKDEFLAMLAHELRNPLAPIRNAVHVLKLLGPADPNLRRAGDMIERQVRHLARLVDDLLDVSRITRGKIQLQKEKLDLATVVARAVEESRPLIDARGHRLRVTLPPQPVWLVGDATRLVQVLANLLNNAAKYTEEGRDIGLMVEHGQGEAVVRVRDTGLGIPADLLPRVFDLFTQGDRSLARSEGGLGVGLTVVRSLVEMHGGSVSAHSDGPGTGSEFVVRLPALRVKAASPEDDGEAQRAAAPPSPSRRVLVVDDNHDTADSLAVLLKVGGHQVRTAHDGPAALEEAASFRPEVVLLDIGLPRMDGYEVARRLREEVGLRGALLVAVTGYGQEEDRRRAEEAGFQVHLVKPADPGAVQALLARRGAPAR
jgi:two-component system CheB/CheR fusion protein